VLVEGAAMPRPEDLPADLARLTRLNAIELSDARWTFDVDRLITAIERVLQDKAPSALLVAVTPSQPAPSQPAPPARTKRKARARVWMALNAAVLLSLAVWIGWRYERQPVPQPPNLTLVKPEVSPAVSEQQPKTTSIATKAAAQEQSARKPTLRKRTVNALKTAGKGISSLVRKVKRGSPLRR
jgi:hypothetical protein